MALMTLTGGYRLMEWEVQFTAIQSQGKGGQNVNKVATAVHLRFDVMASSLPPAIKERIRALRDRRITREGVVVIKAQGQRSQEGNREEALSRLRELLEHALVVRRPRRPTRPGRRAVERRLAAKARRSRLKKGRGRVVVEE